VYLLCRLHGLELHSWTRLAIALEFERRSWTTNEVPSAVPRPPRYPAVVIIISAYFPPSPHGREEIVSHGSPAAR
jgi:hypothetical protein